MLDGKLLGAVSEHSETVLPEIRLAVEGGPAWFSDITVEELIAAT